MKKKQNFIFFKGNKKEGEHVPQGGSWEPSDSSLTFSVFPGQWCQQSPRCIVVNLELTRLWKWPWMDSPARPRRLESELGAPSFCGTRSSFCKRKPLLSECSSPGGGQVGGCGRSRFCVSASSPLPWVPKAPSLQVFYILELTEHSLFARWLQDQLGWGWGGEGYLWLSSSLRSPPHL